MSSEKRSIANGVVYSFLAPVAIGAGASALFVFGVDVLTVVFAAALTLTGIVWFGWACFARRDIFEERD